MLGAAPGDLTPSFGGGIIDVAAGPNIDFANAVAVQADGSVVVGGQRQPSTGISQNSSWMFLRRTTGGAKDASFGGGSGRVILNLGGNFGTSGKPDGRVAEMLVQDDGTILASGCALDSTGSYFNPYVARLHADGSLDTSFGSGGTASTTFGDFACAVAIARARDHKLLVAGYYQSAVPEFSPFIMRLTKDGVLDPTFGTGGIFRAPASIPVSQLGIATSLTIQPDNRIVVTMSNPSYPYSNSAFLRLKYDGTLDASFGSGGIAALPMHTQGIGSVAIQPDGKIVAALNEESGLGGVVRVNANGGLDTSFNAKGWIEIGNLLVSPLLLLPTGQILVSGDDQNDSSKLIMARVTATGILDTSFTSGDGQIGIVETPNPGGYVEVHGLALEHNGRVVAAGRSGMDQSSTNTLIARFRGNPLRLDPKNFAFTSVTNVPVSTVQVSDAVMIKGLTDGAYVPVTVRNGKYSINGDPFTSMLGYTKNGDLIMVEHTSAATAATDTITAITVGGLNSPADPWHARGAIVAKFTSTTQ